ncbi:helix-turn-helix domain-containing protein [Subsaxibacter sp. CAU 1640]|uniref:helix-turn-helix domain-containing protein n=1 Tax=Subsaxibacter sp. CAU 1640 TaxID=2933271 RepID=UPI002002B61F|nr:AraC family transcriptional regulator [Subsaxibacter sp. CAU 1640]MCK7591280.1 helix-turn-helix domain-containing protein [Subsaxibacter sp. CAU 1640]
MDTKVHHRMQVINTMLLEMASGNFFYRIERNSENDDIEALILTLNMLAEEIQDTIIHQGFANIDDSILDIVQMSFVLDHRGHILMVNQQACNILSSLYDDFIGQGFECFLTEQSKTIWKSVWKKIKNKGIFDTTINIKFKSKGDLIIPKTAYISTFCEEGSNKSSTLITIIHHSNYKNKLDSDLKKRIIQDKGSDEVGESKTKKPKLRLSFEDIRKIRDGHDIIINNLEKDLPSLKEFALQIGTNEFKLKYGFKELYGTTVHRFLMQERLRKAQMMIQYSDVSLKTIAYMVGFKSMPHFSRTFKKRYDYSPSDLRNNTILENE